MEHKFSNKVNFVIIVILVIMFLGCVYRSFDLVLDFFWGGGKIKAHEMERNEVVICKALSNFHLEIEWTRVAGEHLD